MKKALTIFRFLEKALVRGERTVLVTLNDVTGSSSRAPGAHIAFSATGAYAGSLSGGCVEAAVVSEALAVLQSGTGRCVPFGAGSRYIDIRLPCGGAIDLIFTPNPPLSVVSQAIERLQGRSAVSLSLTRHGGVRLTPGSVERWSGDTFTATHEPDLCLAILGQGAEVTSLARLALAYGVNVRIFRPDETARSLAEESGAEVTPLLTPTSTADLATDPYTAIVFLFHDHDWERALLLQGLGWQESSRSVP